MATEIMTGKLFKVSIHTGKRFGDVLIDGEPVDSAEYGYCGDDVQPTEGQAQICCERYSLVLADPDDCDENGNLILAEGLTADDVTVEPVEWEIGEHDSDGTATIVCVGEDTFAVTA